MSHRVLNDALLISDLSVQERKNREERAGKCRGLLHGTKKGRVVPVCAIKASEGSRGMGPLILGLGTRGK